MGDASPAPGQAQAGKPPAAIARILTLEMVRVTERAAMAASAWRGKGDEKQADSAAVAAMREELDRIAVDGRIVIGEGEQGEAESLFIGEKVGTGKGPEVDIAVEPLEGTTLCAKNQPDAISVLAVAERGGLLNVPEVYMTKIAIGPGYPEGLVDLDQTPMQNVRTLAAAKGVPVSEITACVLDRPRHAGLIEDLRVAGVPVKLISDGDIAGIIHTTNTDDTGIDIYLGSGKAREGVLAAAALRCMGGQMQGRLILDSPDKRQRAERLGIRDANRKYDVAAMVSGDVVFAATGVTDGSLLDGARLHPGFVTTSTLVMRSSSRTVRWITARHAR